MADPHKILLIDDSFVSRTALKEVILAAHPDMLVLEASDADNAMDVARRDPPQMIIFDINIYGESGIGLVEQMHQQAKKAVLIVLTHIDQPDYKEALFRSGADFVRPKTSVSGSEITALISSVLN